MKKNKPHFNKIEKNDVYKSLLNLKDALADTVSEKTDGVKNRAGEILSDLLENFQSKTSDYQNEIEERIADKPLQSVGLAIGLGILIAKIIL